jgi:hypothetical protein
MRLKRLFKSDIDALRQVTGDSKITNLVVLYEI